MTKNQNDRIAVAKDVIAGVKSGWYDATNVIYFSADEEAFLCEKDVGKELRDVLPNRTKKCNVCAKGAIFVSTIMKFDNFTVTTNHNSGNLNEISADSLYDSLFSGDELEEIESCFEGTGDEANYGWYFIYRDRNERLIAMMECIVRNNGKFVSTDIKKGKQKNG